jgi:hypothetical protein
MEKGLVDGLQLLLTAEETSYESLSKHSRTEVDDLQADALFLLQDAKRITWFPFYRVDPALEREFRTWRYLDPSPRFFSNWPTKK